MGGDLNFKKDWHTQKISNIRKVWEAEQKVEEEKKRGEQLLQEIKRDRERMDLEKMQEAAGLIPYVHPMRLTVVVTLYRKRSERLDWMYAGPNSATAIAEEREAYLLGKKRIDVDTLPGQQNQEMERALEVDSMDMCSSAHLFR